MEGVLSILIVDDSPSDAKLIVRELSRNSMTVDWERVDTREDMLAALKRRSIHAVISDWSMPKFSAPGALSLLQELELDLPFIIVSGTVGEEAAADAMRAGAHDYVLKDRLIRLTPALERELSQAERRRQKRDADRALRASEARFRRLAQSGIVGMAVATGLGVVVEANDALLRLIGYTREEFAAGAIDWTQLTPPEWREADERALQRLATDGVAHTWEKELLRRDGTRVPVLVALAMLEAPAVLVLISDISAQKSAEAALQSSQEQLRQSQKMEAVGRLAGGIAHDFNNLLSVILGQGQMVMEDLSLADPLRADVEEIVRAGQRASDLTKQLLLFSRQQVIEPRVLDLNEVLESMERMLGRILGEDIDLVWRLEKPLARVQADPGHVHQVVMNLVVNARDAMPKGGKLTIETCNVDLGEEFVRTHLGVQPGPYVMMTVSDTGVGMDKETQSRVFEPFFTTKDRAKGTGLGLSTVFGIVQQSGGTVWVYSELGIGTTFKVYLPKVDAEPQRDRPSPGTLPRRGGETILLVEDDEQVRLVARGILARNGYMVLEARGGAEALLISESHPGKIHLLLTDVVMPLMNGPDVARRLRPARPDMKVLFMSGYTDDSIVRHGVVEGDTAFVQKPLTPNLLTRKVRETLDEDSSEAC
jgi:two-component system cell cycle sensor histidine kinase/response regulator CckA